MIKVVAHTSSSDELARIVSAPVFVDVCSAVTELIAAVETQRQERVTKLTVLDVRAPESTSFQAPVLVNIGGNQYAESAASGVPQISAPGSTNHGTLQGSAQENSNVNLTTELVNLITAQRNYQANAQTIKTQQAVDQTLLNLR